MEDYLTLYESCAEDRNNPYFSPLMEKDYTNLPDTLILTAEFDPLRDEGEEYGKRLKEAGNYVENTQGFGCASWLFCTWNQIFACTGKF